MLDTDQLRSFLAIVDEGSFTRAAERVHKTQSAVSMHVRRLEEQLGCALFVKQGRGARLTAEGEQLVEYARRILREEAGAIAALSRKGLRGTVRFGVPDDYAEAYPRPTFCSASTTVIPWSRSPSPARTRSSCRGSRAPARSISRWSPISRAWRDSS